MSSCVYVYCHTQCHVTVVINISNSNSDSCYDIWWHGSQTHVKCFLVSMYFITAH